MLHILIFLISIGTRGPTSCHGAWCPTGNDFHPLDPDVDFSRRTPVQGLVRSKPSLEEQLKPQPSLELVPDERLRSILSKTLLQHSPESLNDRDGAGASNSTESMVHPKAAKDGGETVGSKLRTFSREGASEPVIGVAEFGEPHSQGESE
jgi:hypothetical protein